MKKDHSSDGYGGNVEDGLERMDENDYKRYGAFEELAE